MSKRITEQLKQFLELTKDLAFIMDFDNRIEYVNQAAQETLGYNEKELLNTRIFDLVHADDLAKAYHFWKEGVVTADTMPLFELRFKSKNQDYEWLEWNTVVNHSLGLIYAAARDVSGRKNLERSKQEAEERALSVFEKTSTAKAIVSPEGRYLQVNRAFIKILGYSEEEICKLRFHHTTHPEDLALVEEYTQQLINGEIDSFQMEGRYFKKNGEMLWALSNVSMVRSPSGEPAYLIGEIHDITENKKFQEEMSRLERFNLVAEMAAGIGHEIRNPMTSVRGFLQLLQRKEELQKYQEYLVLMIEELDRANSIINEFLSLTKNKALELKPHNLNTILKNVRPLIEANAYALGVEVKMELNELPDLMLNGGEMRQLILNLTRNGLDAMEQAGNLTIKTYVEQDNVVLAIKDQGNGIAPEVAEKIPTPFFTTKENGTGLGLSVCYAIAKRHKANINFESDLRGTTFYVRFPI